MLALPCVSEAQMVPDNENVLRRTIDAASPFNYTTLMMRYNAGDATLTVEDYHYLYYGYAYREEYNPLMTIPAEDKLLTVFARGDELGERDLREIIDYGLEVMGADPFSPRNLNYLTYAYGMLGDTINERINADRFEKVLEVIEASGNGLKEETPKHVLRFAHAADVINSRGLEVKKRMIISRTVEYIDLEKKDGKVKGYYFDYSRVYWKKPEGYDNRQKKWEMYTPPVTAPAGTR